MLVGLQGNKIVPSQYTINAKAARLDIITWTLERSHADQRRRLLLPERRPVINKSGDTYELLDVPPATSGFSVSFPTGPARSLITQIVWDSSNFPCQPRSVQRFRWLANHPPHLYIITSGSGLPMDRSRPCVRNETSHPSPGWFTAQLIARHIRHPILLRKSRGCNLCRSN